MCVCFCACLQRGVCEAGWPGAPHRGLLWKGPDERGQRNLGEHIEVWHVNICVCIHTVEQIRLRLRLRNTKRNQRVS